MSNLKNAKNDLAPQQADEVSIAFGYQLITFAKATFGVLRIKEIVRDTLSHRDIHTYYGDDGFPLLEDVDIDTLRAIAIGISHELVKVFGVGFTETFFEKTVSELEKKYSAESITKSIMPVIPSGFLEARRAKALSKEELERKVAEKTVELQKINDTLEETVKQRMKELNQLLQEQQRAAQMLVRRDAELTRANDHLLKLDEVKSNFVSVVAHQLRTPLSGIKWTLNLLINGDLGELKTEQKTFLFKAYESNDRMISLVNDMLGADRIDSGKMHYSFQPIQMLDVVDNVLFELIPQANARSLKVHFDHSPKDLPKVHADPERIRAVFQNLLENAIKYSRTNGTIEVTMKVVPGDLIEVRLKDDGIGIPKEQQKNIFGRFFRASNAVKAETDGSGLGLYIVKNIIERHGGKIWFESVEGSGVTFFFTLPVCKNEEKGSNVPAPDPVPTAVDGQPGT